MNPNHADDVRPYRSFLLAFGEALEADRHDRLGLVLGCHMRNRARRRTQSCGQHQPRAQAGFGRRQMQNTTFHALHPSSGQRSNAMETARVA